MLAFFQSGGVFLFDENDPASERTFYRIEDIMGEEAGADICEGYVDEDGNICIYYDGSVMSEEDAIAKYEHGEYVRQL